MAEMNKEHVEQAYQKFMKMGFEELDKKKHDIVKELRKGTKKQTAEDAGMIKAWNAKYGEKYSIKSPEYLICGVDIRPYVSEDATLDPKERKKLKAFARSLIRGIVIKAEKEKKGKALVFDVPADEEAMKGRMARENEKKQRSREKFMKGSFFQKLSPAGREAELKAFDEKQAKLAQKEAKA